jgi:alanyl-tRNA synthetase
MSMTRRVYLDDPYCRNATVEVRTVHASAAGPAAVLDATIFYPEGGGQPADRGTIGPARVLDVQVGPDGEVNHLLDQPLAPGPHLALLDWARRFDHMQQHSGQHLLSRCFEILAGADTVSFHLGPSEVTIDLDREVDATQIAAAEELANRLVFEDRPLHATSMPPAAAAALGARSPEHVSGNVRVVTIAEFDHNACGGTHVRRTGEIGPVKVRRIERVRSGLRVFFHCGWRSLADYAFKHEAWRELAQRFTTGERDVPALVARLAAERPGLERRIRDLEVELARRRAGELVAAAEQSAAGGGYRLVRHMSESGLEAVRALAGAVAAQGRAVALIGCMAGGRPRLVAAAAADLEIDLGPIVREAAAVIGGRGGGKPLFAEAGGEDAARLGEALAHAEARVRAVLGAIS